MVGPRHIILAVAGAVLAASGVTVIAFAMTAQTSPSAGSDAATAVSSAPTDSPPPPGEHDSFTPPTGGVDDSVLLPSSEPAAIDIPAIEVHSEMQQVGLTAEHTLEVPAPGPYYDQAAWYKHSATPGAAGPSVIVGHVDSAANGPSVFFGLGNLRPGDEVLVTRRDGMVAVFEVESVNQYSKDEFPTDLVYGATDDAALRLITCGGEFDSAERSYRDNIVVFATLVGSHRVPASP